MSDLAGSATLVAVVMVAITQACEILGLPILTEMVGTLGATLTRLAVAGVILGAGLLLGSSAGRAIQDGARPNSRALAHTARAAIVFFAAALALRQAGLPAEIVGIAFGAVVGGLAIGAAVALGIGGRHAAARVLDRVVANFDAPSPNKSAQEVTAGKQPDASPPASV